MDKENENTSITKDDLKYIKDVFSKDKKPISLDDLTKKLAYYKNSGQLQQKVKIYDPDCRYETGDLIYKTYDEALTISSKGVEHFQGSVVLKVINKISYESFNCEMLEVDFSGAGIFRKHIDYMKKSKTQVLLPSNQNNKCKESKILDKQKDPRLHELPMTLKDLRALEKNLIHSLSKSGEYFHWNEFWQLKSNQVKISEAHLKAVQAMLKEAKKSISAADIVTKIFKIKPDSNLFDLHCKSLNSALDKHRKTFIFVTPEEGGKWHLKEIMDSFLKDLPLSAKKAKVPSFENPKKLESALHEDFPLKLYPTWRQILSGGLVVPKKFNKKLSPVREYRFKDLQLKKEYTVYYFPSLFAFIGLKKFYESYKIHQGAGLTLKKAGPYDFLITVKTIKKKFEAPQVKYDPEKDEFILLDEESFSYCSLNKIVFLEKDTLKHIFSLTQESNKKDLRELLILILTNFGLESDNLFLNSSRAFHLVDLLKMTYMEDVEFTFFNSPEFYKSAKKAGIYFYKEETPEEAIIEGEVKPAPGQKPLTAKEKPHPKDHLPEIGTIAEEISVVEGEEELRVLRVVPVQPKEKKAAPVKKEAAKKPTHRPKEKAAVILGPKAKKAAAKPSAEKPAKPKKAKEIKKKGRKIKLDAERAPRRRKGIKKIREEEIELEESEMEALFAIKTVDKKEPAEAKAKEKPPKEKKVDYKDFVKKEEPKFGIFASKLKTALDVSKQTKKKPTKKKRRR